MNTMNALFSNTEYTIYFRCRKISKTADTIFINNIPNKFLIFDSKNKKTNYLIENKNLNII